MYDVGALIAQPGFLEQLAASLDGAAPPPLLRDAKLMVTGRCNLRCQMCKHRLRRDEPALDTARWCSLLDQPAALGCRKVHFSGGEVFARPDFLALVEHAVGLGLKANLSSNATLIDRERAKRLVQAGTHSISVSIDHPGPRQHDAIRSVPGAFKQAVRAVGWLQRAAARADRRHRLKLRINVVLMRDN